jgi:tetratricopeptide (TPR) repeat protein
VAEIPNKRRKVMERELYKFNPQRMTKEELEATFVGREDLLKLLLDGLKEQAKKKHNQHIILRGPRGIGKTHILSLVYFKVKEDKRLNKTWIPLQLAEEEFGIANLKDLFIRLLEELSYEIDNSELSEFVEKIKTNPLRVSEDRLYAYLKDYLNKIDKRILLIFENIDLVFGKFSKIELKKLRNILMNEPYILIYGSTLTLFNEFVDEDKPFYRLFDVRSVDELKEADFEHLLQLRLKLDGKRELLDKFSQISPRIKALYILTSGNPRLLLICYQFIAFGELKEVLFYLNRILDDHNQYFLDKIERLSSQQQVIIDRIAKAEVLITPKDIAKSCGMKINTITAQIHKLVKLGYLAPLKVTGGRGTYYELNERLFRIWYQMRTGGRYKKRLRFLVEFLQIWYPVEELKKKREELSAQLAIAKSIAEREETKEILGYFEEALMRKPEVVVLAEEEAWKEIEEGTAYAHKGQYDEAISCYQEAVKIKEDMHWAWYNMGIAYAHKGQYDEAITCYDKALEINPRLAEAWYNKGNILDDLGRHNEAITCYDKALEINPRDALAWYNIGIAYAYKGQYDEAISCYQKAVKIKEDKHEAWYNMGTAYYVKGKYDEAITCYKEAVKIKEDMHEAWNNMGLAYYDKGQYDEAIACYQEAVKIKEDDHEAWYNMGIAYYIKGQYDEAIACYQRAVKIKEDKHKAWYNMGNAYADKGQYDEAIACYREYIKIGLPKITKENLSEFGVYFTGMFIAILKAKRYKEAQELFNLCEEGPKDLTGLLYPIKLVIDYLVTQDKSIIERQVAEYRDIIEEILKTLK